MCGLLTLLLRVGFGCWFDYSVSEPRTSSTSVCHNCKPKNSRCVHTGMESITKVCEDTQTLSLYSPAVTAIAFWQGQQVITDIIIQLLFINPPMITDILLYSVLSSHNVSLYTVWTWPHLHRNYRMFVPNHMLFMVAKVIYWILHNMF